MVWNNRIRVDPFHSFKEDECVGFRCLSMEGSNIETTPSCYNLKECNDACNGYCLHIESTDSICSFLSFIIKDIK
ncbi:MAG: hypothetical protein L6266_03925 [Nanoarchaeota archaeon]|nr:hypothetical protein [Nanoarchaeota archaeon]